MAQAQASSCRAQPNVVTQERNFRRRSLLADSGFTSMSGLDTAAYALAAGRVGREAPSEYPRSLGSYASKCGKGASWLSKTLSQAKCAELPRTRAVRCANPLARRQQLNNKLL